MPLGFHLLPCLASRFGDHCILSGGIKEENGGVVEIKPVLNQLDGVTEEFLSIESGTCFAGNFCRCFQLVGTVLGFSQQSGALNGSCNWR